MHGAQPSQKAFGPKHLLRMQLETNIHTHHWQATGNLQERRDRVFIYSWTFGESSSSHVLILIASIRSSAKSIHVSLSLISGQTEDHFESMLKSSSPSGRSQPLYDFNRNHSSNHLQPNRPFLEFSCNAASTSPWQPASQICANSWQCWACRFRSLRLFWPQQSSHKRQAPRL